MTRKRWAVSPVLVDEAIPEHVRQELVDTTDDGLMAVIVELNLEAGVPPTEVANRFKALLAGVLGDDRAEGRSYEISTGYQRCLLRREEITELLMADHDNRDDVGRRAIFRIWPDYVIRPQIDLSCSTIKVDAASRTYAASGAEIVWAVLDTGIDGGHPHFSEGTLDDPKVKDLHADFTWLVRREPEPSPLDRKAALSDEDGHGTHVAGIIAGRTPDDYQPYIASLRPTVGDQNVDDADWPKWTQRQLGPGRTLAGMAPQARLISLKVLDSSTGVPRTTSSTLMRALQYVREMNGWGRNLQIHGVNLSLGCRWLPEDYAAGQSPLCRELNLLVGTGVVAVVSAGNSGSAIGGEVESGGHAPGQPPHLRDLVHLSQGPDAGWPPQARSGRARRADHLGGQRKVPVGRAALQAGRRRIERRSGGRCAGGWRAGGGRLRRYSTDRLLRGGERDLDGGAARVRSHCRVPLDPSRVHRPTGSR
jgi:hypothetical protein